MKHPHAVLLLTLGGIVGVACGHPEKTVVDQYFNAVRRNDTQTLNGFAMVTFDKPVESWEIEQTIEESKNDAPLSDLVKKAGDAEAELNNNQKAYKAYYLDHTAEVDQVRPLLKDKTKIPAKLQGVAGEWKKFTEREKELKRSVADSKDAVEREKRNMSRSVGPIDSAGGLAGTVTTKKIQVKLVISGQPQNYVITLRKYDVQGRRSRWMVQSLTPAG